MEFAVYVAIGVGSVSILVSTIGLIYWYHDNKRQKQQEQKAAPQ
jgi:hypothetical protein